MLTNNQSVRSLTAKQVLDCLAGITLKIQKNLNLEEILKVAVTETRQLLQADQVLIYRFGADGNSTVVVQSMAGDFLPLNDEMTDSCGDRANRVEYCCINGIEEIDDLNGDCLELLANSGIRPRLAAPIFCGEHLWGWLIACHCSGTRQWQPLEIELQQQLATLLAIAIRQSELQQQLSAEMALKTPQQSAETTANRAFSTGQRTSSIPSFSTLGQQFFEQIDAAVFIVEIDTKSTQLEGFNSLNRDGELVYLSPAYEQIWGRSRQPLYQNFSTFFNAIYPTDLERAQLAKTQPRLGKSVEVDYRVIRPDGSICWIRERSFPVRNDRGEIYCLAGIAWDISERQRSEAVLQQREVLFRQLVEKLPAVLFLRQVDSGDFLYISPVYDRIFGDSHQRLYRNSYLWTQQIHPEDRRRICLKLQTSSPIEAVDLEYRIVRNDGVERWIWERNFPVVDESGKAYRLVGIAEDITQRKQAVEQLRYKEQLFRQLTENIQDVFSIFDPVKQQQLYISPAYQRIWGRRCQDLYANPDTFLDAVHPEDFQRVRDVLSKKMQGECTDVEYRIYNQTEEIRSVRDRGFPIRDQYGKVYRIVNIIENISDRALARTELKQAKDQLRSTIDAVPGFVSWMSADGRYLGVNKRLADSFNLSPDKFVGQELGFLNSSSQFTEFMLEFLASYQEAMSRTIENSINGNKKYYLIVAQKYQQGRAAVSIGLDITERKLAEKQIQDSLEEKEVLLKEIHHRVKNNLQIVSSLLDLQSMKIREPQTQQLFRASQSRVKSIALIHEKLYQSENLERVNCYEYLYSLANYLFQTYSINPEKIELQLDVDPISLNLDTAIPCGLIINELVSNAFKHAFPGELKGLVKIRLKSSGQTFVLEVSNNGVICPKPIDIKDKKTLGIQLINALIQQLSGEVEIDRSKGTSFQIKFREISTG